MKCQKIYEIMECDRDIEPDNKKSIMVWRKRHRTFAVSRRVTRKRVREQNKDKYIVITQIQNGTNRQMKMKTRINLTAIYRAK